MGIIFVTLEKDIRTALNTFEADIVLLSECGEIEKGLDATLWLPMLRNICGPGFYIQHQSHYTSIIRLATIEVTAGPSLQGPLTTMPGHEYRMCQHLQVVIKGSAAKPIDIYNVHSPSSKKHVLTPTVRKNILEWFANNVGTKALIGGDLNADGIDANSIELIVTDPTKSPNFYYVSVYYCKYKFQLFI